MTLIERLEQATGPDTLLDDDLHWHFSDWRNLGGYWREHKVTGEQQCFTYVRAPAYTADLNAALALVEEKLPGWMVAVAGPWTWAAHTERAGHPIWCAEIVRCTEESGVGYREVNDLEHKAPTPALAVLIALLKALGDQHD